MPPRSRYERIFSFKHIQNKHVCKHTKIISFKMPFSEDMNCKTHHQLSSVFSKTNQIVPTKKMLAGKHFHQTVAKWKILSLESLVKLSRSIRKTLTKLLWFCYNNMRLFSFHFRKMISTSQFSSTIVSDFCHLWDITVGRKSNRWQNLA